jgi:hypothetical protein
MPQTEQAGTVVDSQAMFDLTTEGQKPQPSKPYMVSGDALTAFDINIAASYARTPPEGMRRELIQQELTRQIEIMRQRLPAETAQAYIDGLLRFHDLMAVKDEAGKITYIANPDKNLPAADNLGYIPSALIKKMEVGR